MSENKRAWLSPIRSDGLVNLNYGDTLLATSMAPGEAGRVADLINGEDKPEWLEHLAVLRVGPGDVLVLRSAMALSRDAASRLAESVEKVLPGTICVVLDSGLELGVVRKDET